MTTNDLNIPDHATLDMLSLRQLRQVALACTVKPELVRTANDVPAVLTLLGVPITYTVAQAIEACTGTGADEPKMLKLTDEFRIEWPNGDVMKIRLIEDGQQVEVYVAGASGERDVLLTQGVSSNVLRLIPFRDMS